MVAARVNAFGKTGSEKERERRKQVYLNELDRNKRWGGW